MESVTTSSDVTAPVDAFATRPSSHNFSTTRSAKPPSSAEDVDEVFLWLPLIFVLLFAVIVITLIILSRFNFSSACCGNDDRRRSSHGESAVLYLTLRDLTWEANHPVGLSGIMHKMSIVHPCLARFI